MIPRLETPVCPAPSAATGECITLAHGEGGRLMRRLLHERILPLLGNTTQSRWEDAARLRRVEGDLAFTTDSFVVSPLFFPGGDIGRLCVFGTVNDLVVSGARPRCISLSLIIEEGLSLETFERVLRSIAAAAREAEVEVATGDTKVVPRGAADGLFINTAGVGEFVLPAFEGPRHLRTGDEILVSGPIGQHGIAVLTARGQLELRPEPVSDCAPLTPAVDALRQTGIPVVSLRDATRGGVAAVLHEWAAECEQAFAIDESQVPVSPVVRGACELLGLDPLHVANEGTMVVAVRQGAGEAAVRSVAQAGVSRQAAVIGRVQPKGVSPVLVKRGLGRYMPLDEPQGAPLPRIC